MKKPHLLAGAALLLASALGGGVTGAWLVSARLADAQPTTISANRFAVTSFGASGPSRATLEELGDGSAALSFPDTSGQPRMTAGLTPAGQPVITLRDTEGRPRAVLALREDGSPHLVFLDKYGYLQWSAP